MPVFAFEHLVRDGVHAYVCRAGDSDLPPPLWRGLANPPYSEDEETNPWYRYGLNNEDGEVLLAWRALSWTLLGSGHRLVIPLWDRDAAAARLDVARDQLTLIRWQHELDITKSDYDDADSGFVPARVCVPGQPAPDAWQRLHAANAGLFTLANFHQLTAVDLVVSMDVYSEINLFGVRDMRRLASVLQRPERPLIADVLQSGDIFIDLAVVRDRFLGYTSYLVIKSLDPIDDYLREQVEHYEDAFSRYERAAPSLESFDEFCAAVDGLLLPNA